MAAQAPQVPASLEHAYSRLMFPPSYVVVGVYRLFTDRSLAGPAWAKCHHGVRRGAIVGLAWAALTFRIQRTFIELFYMKSPKVMSMSETGLFGYQLPISAATYATLFFISTQVETILRYFLKRNIGVARERVYAQTVASRGKGPEFWRPYVEEWPVPPKVTPQRSKGWSVERLLSTFAGRLIFKNVFLAPFISMPIVGIVTAAWLRGLGTARYLHIPYFTSKKMTPEQQALFVEERKWEYRAFGFTAALLEGLPLIGLVFTISNRIGAAMWAHDLEKNQHYVAEQHAAGKPISAISGGASSALTGAVENTLASGRAALLDTAKRAKAAAAPPHASASCMEAEGELGPQHVPGEL